MEKIEYLKKFSKDLEIVDYSVISENDKITFPNFWKNSLSQNIVSKKIELILSEWNKYLYQFQSTYTYLLKNLVNVELIKHKGSFSLLYSIKNLSGKEVYYEGKNPLTKNIPDYLKERWDEIPKSFQTIYNELHNGWYYFASESNGLSSVENIILLSDMDWGILDDIDVNSLPFELNNCLGVFQNGLGDYVSIDLNSKVEKNGFIWWHNKPPKLNLDAWPVIDEWTKIGIEK